MLRRGHQRKTERKKDYPGENLQLSLFFPMQREKTQMQLQTKYIWYKKKSSRMWVDPAIRVFNVQELIQCARELVEVVGDK